MSVDYPLLSQIHNPKDLRQLDRTVLPELCRELRAFIIDSVSQHGGHLAAGLGVIELTVALHYVLDTPEDLLVWDVGHQAYAHKILTGRREQFDTNRRWQGLSGFPKRSESPYDSFGVGHSSTSISATLGMALASRLKGLPNKKHVAVIGDGAMTAGIAFEGLNHAGTSKANLLVILNDNNMSIDPAVGALNQYLTGKKTSPSLLAIKKEFKNLKKRLPRELKSDDATQHLDTDLNDLGLKAALLFEALGFTYFGPSNGHEVLNLIDQLQEILSIPGPKLLHLKTQKGKGYDEAERNQTRWHATGAFDKITGQQNAGPSPKEGGPVKYQEVFGRSLLELARHNPLIMGITPAMPSGSSMNYMIAEMPDRALDVGIAEQHAVTLSAGLATQGLKVFCHLYSTFAQRAYDSIIHDVAIQDLPVIFCLDRAGLVGEDGATHQGVYDLAYLRCIPNLIISAPMNEEELRNLMFTAQLDEQSHPFVIRYPRGKGVLTHWANPFKALPIGRGRLISSGEKIAILSLGHVGNMVQEALGELGGNLAFRPAHYDLRYLKPLDENLLHQIAQNYSQLVTVEDGTIRGGFGSAVLEFLNEHQYKLPVRVLGVPDEVIEQGSQKEQRHYSGIDVSGISHCLHSLISEISSK